MFTICRKLKATTHVMPRGCAHALTSLKEKYYFLVVIDPDIDADGATSTIYIYIYNGESAAGNLDFCLLASIWLSVSPACNCPTSFFLKISLKLCCFEMSIFQGGNGLPTSQQ